LSFDDVLGYAAFTLGTGFLLGLGFWFARELVQRFVDEYFD
jgi:hypothetical protein